MWPHHGMVLLLVLLVLQLEQQCQGQYPILSGHGVHSGYYANGYPAPSYPTASFAASSAQTSFESGSSKVPESAHTGSSSGHESQSAINQQATVQQQAGGTGNSNINEPLQAPASNINSAVGSSSSSKNSPRSLGDREGSPIFRLQNQTLSSTSIRLVWSLMNGYPVDHFDIQYGPVPEVHQFTLSKLNGTQRDYTFHQLQPETTYQFQINSYSGSGQYKPALILVTTPAPNAPNPFERRDLTPMGVKAETKSNNSVQLSWIEPNPTGKLQQANRYNIIRYYVLNSTQPGQQQQQAYYLNVTTSPRDSKLIVQKLKAATEYAFAVKTIYYASEPHRPLAQSGFSLDTSARTHDLEPTPPRNFTIRPIGPTSEEVQANLFGKLELIWQPPEQINGQLRGYVILYSHEAQAPDEQWNKIEVSQPNTNNWFVANIRHGASYFFKIRAINQRGQSQDSETRSFMAPPSPLVAGSPTSGGGAGNSLLDREQGDQSMARDLMAINGPPIPPSNILLILIIVGLLVFAILAVVGFVVCGTSGGRSSSVGRRKNRKSSYENGKDQRGGQNNTSNNLDDGLSTGSNNLLAGKSSAYGAICSHNGPSSTVAARVGTLARRRDQNALKASLGGPNQKQDQKYWINPMDQNGNGNPLTSTLKQSNSGSLLSDKAALQQEQLNLTMVSLQRDSPSQFATTQLAQALPEYRMLGDFQQSQQQQQLMQQASHYHPGHNFNQQQQQQLAQFNPGDQLDGPPGSAADALMTMSRRQQQQLQKYRLEFAQTSHLPPIQQLPIQTSTAGSGPLSSMGAGLGSPNQQPPPPPPLNIEQQQQHQQQQSAVYGQHPGTRSLRLHRPTLYNPVNGSFIQQQQQQQQQAPGQLLASAGLNPPNYTASSMAGQGNFFPHSFALGMSAGGGANTLQFAPSHHSSSTLMSRRSTNTLRSFQNSTYGQLGAIGAKQYFMMQNGQQQQQQQMMNQHQSNLNQAPKEQQLLESHQAVINQLNQSSYPSLPLKHVSAVKPQIVSTLEDQVELELAEKDQEHQQQHQDNQLISQQQL